MILHPESGWEDERRKKELSKKKELSEREKVLMDPLAASQRSDARNKKKKDQEKQDVSDWVKGQMGFGS